MPSTEDAEVEITLMQNVRLDLERIGRIGDVVKVAPQFATTLVHGGLALEGRHDEVKSFGEAQRRAAVARKRR